MSEYSLQVINVDDLYPMDAMANVKDIVVTDVNGLTKKITKEKLVLPVAQTTEMAEAIALAQAAEAGAIQAMGEAETAQGITEGFRDETEAFKNAAAAIVSGGPRGVYATAAALIAANPDHAYTYVVTDDGKWYYWSGSAFTAGAVFTDNAITDFYNVSVRIPIAPLFYTLTTAIVAIPVAIRKNGLHVPFFTSDNTMETWKFNCNDVNGWLDEQNWERVPNNSSILTDILDDGVAEASNVLTDFSTNANYSAVSVTPSPLTFGHSIATPVNNVALMLGYTGNYIGSRLNAVTAKTGDIINVSMYYKGHNTWTTRALYIRKDASMIAFDAAPITTSLADGWYRQTGKITVPAGYPSDTVFEIAYRFSTTSTITLYLAGLTCAKAPLSSEYNAGHTPDPYVRTSALSTTIQEVSSPWNAKSWCSYGDSITAIGNTNDANSWQMLVHNLLKFATHYGRGIGGQMFAWNPLGTWFANADGSYNSRPPAVQPEGTTIHYGSFCSWDRIKTMIPSGVDLIFIMGGTNDMGNNIPIGDIEFNPLNTTDALWNSEVGGGDFDISTFKGAVASTIIKMQRHAPNAIIVLGTPLSGRGEIAGENMTEEVVNTLNLATSDYAKAEIEVAEIFSIPYINVFGTTGINQFNRATYIANGVHPYSIGGLNKGCKAIARSVVGGLKAILPNI